MGKKFLKPWIILDADGAVLSCHCDCTGGLSQVCSHAAALAFYLHLTYDEEQSCTEKLARWPVPTINKKIEFKKIKDINFGKPTTSYASALILILNNNIIL